jgi:tRNA pseudouridine55 synthase
MMPSNRGLHGWLVIDKPRGITSNRVVEQVRRSTGAKAGHAGTLDPLATGVLPIALGEATKTVSYAMHGRKTYHFRVRWGIARTTDDCEGEIVDESDARPSRPRIEAALPRFIGTIAQVPPVYSAIKIGGQRAYALSRAAKPPFLPARPVEIANLRLISEPDCDHAEFEAVVGKGTYIRALARDLAIELGTVGHITALRRLSVGPFTEAQAISLETSAELAHIPHAHEGLLPIEAALDGMPALALTAAEANRLRCGQRIMPSEFHGRSPAGEFEAGTVVSAWHNDALVALATIEDGGLRPLRVINS